MPDRPSAQPMLASTSGCATHFTSANAQRGRELVADLGERQRHPHQQQRNRPQRLAQQLQGLAHHLGHHQPGLRKQRACAMMGSGTGCTMPLRMLPAARCATWAAAPRPGARHVRARPPRLEHHGGAPSAGMSECTEIRVNSVTSLPRQTPGPTSGTPIISVLLKVLASAARRPAFEALHRQRGGIDHTKRHKVDAPTGPKLRSSRCTVLVVQ